MICLQTDTQSYLSLSANSPSVTRKIPEMAVVAARIKPLTDEASNRQNDVKENLSGGNGVSVGGITLLTARQWIQVVTCR